MDHTLKKKNRKFTSFYTVPYEETEELTGHVLSGTFYNEWLFIKNQILSFC